MQFSANPIVQDKPLSKKLRSELQSNLAKFIAVESRGDKDNDRRLLGLINDIRIKEVSFQKDFIPIEAGILVEEPSVIFIKGEKYKGLRRLIYLPDVAAATLCSSENIVEIYDRCKRNKMIPLRKFPDGRLQPQYTLGVRSIPGHENKGNRKYTHLLKVSI